MGSVATPSLSLALFLSLCIANVAVLHSRLHCTL